MTGPEILKFNAILFGGPRKRAEWNQVEWQRRKIVGRMRISFRLAFALVLSVWVQFHLLRQSIGIFWWRLWRRPLGVRWSSSDRSRFSLDIDEVVAMKRQQIRPIFLFRPMNGTLVVCYFCFSIRWLRTSRSLVKRAFRKFTSGGVISRQISGAESLGSKITSPLQSLFNRDPIQMKFSNYLK